MTLSREQLLMLLSRRRRRNRLLLACLATALACGAVAGLLSPQVLTGGVSAAIQATHIEAAPTGALPSASVSTDPPGLFDRLQLDPREAQANAIRWASMTEDQRRALLNCYWQLADMHGPEQDRLLTRFSAFRELPAEKQQDLRQRAQKLREFIKTLSAQDQALLESMSDTDRARHLLQLWQARYGTW